MTRPTPKSSTSTEPKRPARKKRVTLKAVAEYLNLSPATVSLVINRSPVAKSIPQETQDRVFEAARKLDYRPNYMARSLRNQRSYTVGVLVPEISEGYASGILSGIEDHLKGQGYFYLVASHRARHDLQGDYLDLLKDRAVEGFITVATPLTEPPPLSTVAVASHQGLAGVTNLILDHDSAAQQALEHLTDLGHRHIAFFKGQPNSSDTEDRWRSILATANELGLTIEPAHTLQLSGDPSEVFSPEEAYLEGYAFGRKLLESGIGFTSLFAFNDVSAIGAMRAFLDAGLRVPEDVSVVGFDDIQSSAFLNPSLTTVRQPLREMGQLAARNLLERLAADDDHSSARLTVEPELVVRGSTGPPPSEPVAGLQKARRKSARRGRAENTKAPAGDKA